MHIITALALIFSVETPSAQPRLEETGSEQTSLEETAKVMDQQEYLAKVRELIDGITNAWQVEDRVTSLKLSIKVNLLTYDVKFVCKKNCKMVNSMFCSVLQVTKLLMDTTVLQFYPTVFVVVTDMLDMVGDMVWERIKEKAEHDVDGTLICTLSSMHLYSNPILRSEFYSLSHSVT